MILVTGGTGFLGRHIVSGLLAHGFSVRVLVRDPSRADFPPHAALSLTEGDILDRVSLEQACEGAEYIIHSAAMVSFWKKKFGEMKEVNVTGTANVVNCALEAGVKKLVHISSIAALGRTGDSRIINELSRWKESKYNTHYAKSKYQAELEVYRGIEEGLNAAILNPAVILGPAHQWQSGPPKLWSLVHKGLKWYRPGGTAYVAAEDVAAAARLLLHSPHISGEKFILAAENLTWKQVLSWIAESLGVAAPSREASPALSALIGWISEMYSSFSGKEPLLTRETTRVAGSGFEYDGTAVTQALGLTYSPIRQTILHTGKAFLQSTGKV